MTTEAEFQTFIDYVLLKKHFTDESFIWDETAHYSRITVNAFSKRKDAPFFKSLQKKQGNRKDVVDYLVSCFLFDNNFWIGNAFKDEYEYYHINRMSRFQSLERTFSDDCEKIDELIVNKTFDQIALTNGIKQPIIMELYPSKICLESLALFEHFFGFSRLWFPLNPLLKWRRLLVYKYCYLLRFNERNTDKLKNTYQNLVQSLSQSESSTLL